MTFTKWLALLIAALTASMAAAQQYPARSIRLVVGFPPGAGTDTIALTVEPEGGVPSPTGPVVVAGQLAAALQG